MQRSRSTQRWLSSLIQRPSANALSGWLPFIAALALEAAPVQAWLIVYPATQPGDSPAAMAPFWLVAGILALFAFARRKAAPLGPAGLMGGWLVAAGVALVALARFSPLVFGGVAAPFYSLDWIAVWWSGNFDAAGFAPLVALTIFLGWRGIALGAPALTTAQVGRRFGIGLGALTLAIFGSLAIPPALLGQVSGALLALLALEGFAGLVALALARTQAGLGQGETRIPGAEYTARWQIAALGIACVIILTVSVIGGLLNITASRTLLGWLAPLGAALDFALYWITQAIAYALYLLSVAWLSLFVPKNLPNQQPHLPQPPKLGKQGAPIPSQFGTFGPTAIVILVTVGVVVALILVYLLARMVVSYLNRPIEDEEIEEEREGLDAANLLRRQVRDWWSRRRRRAAVEERDPLRRGSMRWLYRSVMRAGSQAGYERREEESADEYATRLASLLGGSDDDLRAITSAYDVARYGSADADPPAPGVAADLARSARARLEALGQAEAARRGR